MIRCLTALMLAGSLCAATAPNPAEQLEEILARPALDAWAIADLRGVLEQMPAASRAVGLKRLAKAAIPATSPVVARYLNDWDREVAVAAITAVTALWPTEAEHAATVRERIAAPEDEVAAVAIAFALHVGDDLAVPQLAKRLIAQPQDAAARNALRRLTGQDLADGAAWLGWYEQRIAVSSPLMAELARDSAAADPVVAARAVHRLVGLKEQPSVVAELLIAAAARPEQSVHDIARTGLRLIGGPVAACWRPEAEEPLVVSAPPVASSAVAAVSAPSAPPSKLGEWLALGGMAVLGGGAVIAWRRCRPVVVEAAKQLSTRFVRRRKRMTWLN